MELALIDVVASSIIGTQFEARIAAAFVGAPIIYTAMLTQARIFLALVHIHALSIVARLIFETGFAVTTVGADAVDALGVRWTWSAILVKLALVDVLTVAVVGGNEPSGANASVASGLVFTCLLRSTNRFAGRALIDIDALRTIGIQLKASLTSHRVLASMAAVGVDTLLTSCAWISHLALVYVFRRKGKTSINEDEIMQTSNP